MVLSFAKKAARTARWLIGEFFIMARVTVEDCLKVIENRFAMVLLAAARTRQLMKGSRPLVDGYKNNEQVTAL
jgi:DNA-directed RNA polymerase omega subunit